MAIPRNAKKGKSNPKSNPAAVSTFHYARRVLKFYTTVVPGFRDTEFRVLIQNLPVVRLAK